MADDSPPIYVKLGMLQTPQVSDLPTILAPLLVGLEACTTDIVLVLDDYHVITEHEIHAGLAFLLEHLPHQVHLIIATRADPPLRLARLRARGNRCRGGKIPER
jgi:LuxR family transcriptional regulator, maltose regulon positive regulatory protein